MRIAAMIEPHLGMSYAEQLAVAGRAEALGYDAFFRSDHYATGEGEPVASTDAWAVLAGIARETRRIGLGTLVSPVTFRSAGNLAKTVATVDEMAGRPGGRSRVELGMGTGWMEREHAWYGFPFEDVATRFRRLEEHLRAVRGLWGVDGEPFSLHGRFVAVTGARARPVPDPRPRLLVGGAGPSVTPRLAATYADEWNTMPATPGECAERRARLDAACERVGRDPAEVALSAMLPVCVGVTGRDVRRRAERLAAVLGGGRSAGDLLDRLRPIGVVGTPEEAADALGRFAEAGVVRVMLQDLLPGEADHMEVVAREIRPRL
jgi:alkanesulfonate monooxygenase SsuD/methylene tetrahydromethanopterin reductase-like flavin-dependent oxidoreductase (luciferase family)